MSARARRAAVLALVAVVLLSNSLYVGALVGHSTSESHASTAYTATAVDPANASHHDNIVRAVGQDDVVDVDELGAANDYTRYADEYRSAEAAAAVIRRAIESGGAANTSDPDTAFTLQRLAARHRYAVTNRSTAPTYYRIDAAAADGVTSVTAEEVSSGTVAEYLVYRDARLYSGLPERQRDAVDETVSAGEHGYRPVEAEYLRNVADRVLVRDGTYYVFSVAGHADDFGFSARGVASLVLSALGTFAFLAAVLLTALSYARARRES
jgi:hypothetical protein